MAHPFPDIPFRIRRRRSNKVDSRLALAVSVMATGWLSAEPARAQVSLPPINLGDTSFMDGVAGPGLLFAQMVTRYDASSFRDDDGDRAPAPDDLEVVAAVTHIAYLSDRKFLGTYVGAEALLPIVQTDLAISPNVGGSDTGIGDLIVALLIMQWIDQSLFGRPLYTRLNFNFTLPTGDYDRGRIANAGQDTVRFNPYLAATWMASPQWEVSGRLHYLWTSENDDPAPL